MDTQPSASGADRAGATATGARSHRGGASAAAPAPTVRRTQPGKKVQQLSQTAAKRARGQAGNRVGDAAACTTACTLVQAVGYAREPTAWPPGACAVRALAVLQIAGGSDEEGGSEYEIGGAEETSHHSESETSEGKPHKKVNVCVALACYASRRVLMLVRSRAKCLRQWASDAADGCGPLAPRFLQQLHARRRQSGCATKLSYAGKGKGSDSMPL